MQRLSRSFGREKSSDTHLITPFPFEVVPQTNGSSRSASQVHDAGNSATVGILSALDSLSVFELPMGESEGCECSCKSRGHWEDILSLRKGKRSLKELNSDREDTVTLAGTTFTSDTDTLCEPPISSPNNLSFLSGLGPFGEGDISPEGVLRRLFQECAPGKDNTHLLCKALEYATTEELEKEITRVFHVQCQMTQAIIAAQIPWASAIADLTSSEESISRLDLGAESSVQQRLLKALIQSNEALMRALEMYRDLNEDPQASLKKARSNQLQPQDIAFVPSLPEEPWPSTPPPSYGLSSSGTESRVSLYSSDSSQLSSTPRYIRPLPFLPSTTTALEPPEAINIPLPTQDLHAPVKPSLSARRRPPLPQGPRSAQNKGVSDSRQSYPPLLSYTSKDTHSFLHPSRHSFSASSPSLRLRKFKDASCSIVHKEYPFDISILDDDPLSPDASPYHSFSISLPSLTISSGFLDDSNPPDAFVGETPSEGMPIPDDLTTPYPLSGLFSPTPLRVKPDLPDLTGKISRMGDYPAGRGGYADVWKCVMRMPMNECDVAVKVLQSHVYDADLESKIAKRIRREISIWKRLDHGNVLPLLGTVQHFGRYISLVSPWMENGSLVQYLKECGGDMGMLRRLQLACEVGSGLAYLHSSGVIHGDLTGMNVLITNEGKACLCDFGLSSLMLELYDPTFCTSTIGANARWAAPEIYCITGGETVPTATSESDVYSFGCVLLQILSGLIPYHYLARDGQVLLELQNGIKPRRPQEGYITDVLWDHINACWVEPAAHRPTAQWLQMFLQGQFDMEWGRC